MSIIIRQATPDDFIVILALIKEFSEFQKTPEKVHITLEQMHEEKDLFRCFVAETSAKEIIGFASFFLAYYSWTGKALYLDDLYVKEVYRKQSIGKRLLDSVLALARNERCKKVRWQVSKWNTNAIEFYGKMGAYIDDTEINCDLVISGN